MILHNYAKASVNTIHLFLLYFFIMWSFEIGVVSFLFGTLHIFFMNNRVVKICEKHCL